MKAFGPIRLLPVTIFAMAGLLVAKSAQLVHAATATASEQTTQAAPATTAPAHAATAEAPKAAPVHATVASKPPEAAPSPTASLILHDGLLPHLSAARTSWQCARQSPREADTQQQF